MRKSTRNWVQTSILESNAITGTVLMNAMTAQAREFGRVVALLGESIESVGRMAMIAVEGVAKIADPEVQEWVRTEVEMLNNYMDLLKDLRVALHDDGPYMGGG